MMCSSNGSNVCVTREMVEKERLRNKWLCEYYKEVAEQGLGIDDC